MKHGCLLFALFFLVSFTAKSDPLYPACFSNEANLKVWVEKVVTDAPPPDCTVLMMHHLTPHYVKNEKVGEIWIVSAVCKVTGPDGKSDHEMCFVVYHVDSGESELKVAVGIPENKLQEYLDLKPEPTPIGDKEI